jgi:nitrate/TMAO reductase-like tetraheme cytochrome c subunit
MSRRLPDSFYNPVSIVGLFLASVSFVTIVFLTLVDVFQANPPAYIGIISYVVLPMPLVLGLVLATFGVLREKHRQKKGMPASRLVYTLDLNSPRHRFAMAAIGTTLTIFLLFTAYGSYRSFEWTESVSFCGTTCHSVMEPEYTAYQGSPHARVKCVECHVGSGAGWYVKSKLAGAYQVYAVLSNNYPRPIPTPISNLRPAQETCEQCHWPSHFSGEKKVVNTYFRSDSANTRWTVALLMKIGGGSGTHGPSGGIHWHMNIQNEITYVATDSLRQVIPWVRSKNRNTGEEKIFVAQDAPPTPEQLSTLPHSRMDCIDCHNRPAHVYRPPVRMIDRSMSIGSISPSIPWIRTIAVNALVQQYSTSAAASDSIPRVMLASYEEKMGRLPDTLRPLFASAAQEAVAQYRSNFFPTMNVSWKAYPNNIGHMTDLGCFRCHDGNHATADGKVIPKDCNTCHTLMYQGHDPVPTTLNPTGLEFQHPDESIGDAWKTTNCKECHTGQ